MSAEVKGSGEDGSFIRFFNLDAIRALFNLGDDQANRFDVIEEIRQNVAFRGTNLWILIFAIIICSVGLNVNSTAVIIGAMLISPLMGPINGLGVGAATYDMKLIRRSVKNLGVAVVMSVLASAIYFFISPLNLAQSELLARTSPTLYDVIIALFGGLAGIIAATRREKTNVIPGVAIATALMPPLCTAGYGIATGQLAFFGGALYLFFINTVFISFSAWLMVRFMKFPVFEFVDAKREKRVRQLVTVIVLFTTIPSIYYAYTLIDKTIFEQRAQKFITAEFDMPNTHVIERQITSEGDKRRIAVYLIGDPLDEKDKERLVAKMPNYKCDEAELVIVQGADKGDAIDVNMISKQVFEDLYAKSERTIVEKDSVIARLQMRMKQRDDDQLPLADILREAKAAYPGIREFTMNKNLIYSDGIEKPDTALVALVKFNNRPGRAEEKRFTNWVQQRTKMDSVVVVFR
jgi:uncharacterized hydrophobic protein (TIGR00271 family)